MIASLEFVKTVASGIKYWFEAMLTSHNNDETAHHAATDSDALAALSECGILTPAYQDGTFYTDDSGAIYVL